jgi:hypothetical protein
MKSVYIVTLLAKRNKIYNKKGLITNLKGEAILQRSKLRVGLFETQKEAEEIVLSNACDISEDGYYQYAVIEEVGFGLYGLSGEKEEVRERMNNVNWYRWHKQEMQYNKIPNCPKDLENLVSFHR